MNLTRLSAGNQTRSFKGKMSSQDKKPDCFGILDQVFPMTESGLRQTPEKCFNHCDLKTHCLKQAMTSRQAVKVEEEIIDRGSRTGAISFFERWSRKKQIHRKTKEAGSQLKQDEKNDEIRKRT